MKEERARDVCIRTACDFTFFSVAHTANWNFFFSLLFLSHPRTKTRARASPPHANKRRVKMKDCPVPTRAAVFALVRSEIRFILLREKKSKNDDAVVSKRTLARLFVRAFVLASGWDRCRRSLRESGNDDDDDDDDEATTTTTTYRFDDRKPSSRTERNILRVHSTDVGRNSVNFTFTFEAEGGANGDDEEEEEEEDEIKTLLVACPEEGAAIESLLADEKSKKFGEGILELMLKEKIFDHAEPKEKECLKCKEWERRERERRENELVRGYREDPSFSGRGPPSFPRQPLHPGMGPRIDYIGPPDMGPDFGRNF